MDCQYSCNPNDKIIGRISETTYTEHFIIMNLEKILQRIRNLFKLHYIFEKSDLKKQINAIKHYSNEQINMALNVLINDKNEFITDMFGRSGRLVNIGKFYLFQPVELDNKHLTFLERKRPLDYKQDKLTLLVPSSINTKFTIDQKEKEGEDKKAILTLQENFLLLNNPSRVTRKKDWIQNAAWAIQNLTKYNNIDKDDLLNYGLDHLFDILHIDVKIRILNDLNSDIPLDSKFKSNLLSVIKKFEIDIEKTIYYACADYKKKYSKAGFTLIKLDKNKTPNTWIPLPNLVKKEASALVKKYRLKKDKFNNFIGFLTKAPNSKNILFKTKHTVVASGKRTNKGLRCPSGGENRRVTFNRINKLAKNLDSRKKYTLIKQRTANRSSVNIIQSIYGSTDYQQMIAPESKQKGKKNVVSFTETQLCVETELLLRHLDKIEMNDKRWFFGTFEDRINQISEIRK